MEDDQAKTEPNQKIEEPEEFKIFNDGFGFDFKTAIIKKSKVVTDCLAKSEKELKLDDNIKFDEKFAGYLNEYLTHYKDKDESNMKEIWKPIKDVSMKYQTHFDFWAANFAERFTEENISELFDLIVLADFLKINPLHDLLISKLGTFLLKYQDLQVPGNKEKILKLFELTEDMNEHEIETDKETDYKMGIAKRLERDNFRIFHNYDEEHARNNFEDDDNDGYSLNTEEDPEKYQVSDEEQDQKDREQLLIS